LPRLVREARFGPIPASDDLTDEAMVRITYAVRLIGTMRGDLKYRVRPTDERTITDFPADLRYYCATKGLCFEKLDSAAISANEDWQSAV
jgi:hypothetical protein